MIETIQPKQMEQFRRLIEEAALVALRRVELSEEAIERFLVHKEGFEDYLVSGVRRFASEDPTYEVARSILGEDFISPDEVMRARRGVVYSERQLQRFALTTPPPGVLQWCKENGYILVPGPHRALSLLDVRDLEAQYFSEHFGRIEKWESHRRESMFGDTVRSAWIALRKEPTPDSLGKSFSEQLLLLSDEEVVPNAAEVVWCVTTYKAVKGVFLIPDVFVRTSSTDEFQVRVSLGEFGLRDFGSKDDGLNLYSWSDECRYEFVGLASMRR